MRLPRWIAILPCLLAPTVAAGAEPASFPFALEAGTHRNVIVPTDETRAMRLVFPALTVERPDAERAILRPGGDGRVVLQVSPPGEAGSRTGAVLHFGSAPLVLRQGRDRIAVEGALAALSFPPLGTVVFEDMRFTLEWPTRASGAVQEAPFSLSFASARADDALRATLVADSALPLVLSAGEARGRLGVILREGRSVTTRTPPILRGVEIRRGRADLLGGRVATSGEVRLAQDAPPIPAALRGTLSVANLTAMVERLVSTARIPPEQIMPFVLMAGTLGQVGPDGSVTFAVETQADGTLLLNGRPTALTLPK